MSHVRTLLLSARLDVANDDAVSRFSAGVLAGTSFSQLLVSLFARQLSMTASPAGLDDFVEPTLRLWRFFSPEAHSVTQNSEFYLELGYSLYLRCARTFSTRFLSVASSLISGTFKGGGAFCTLCRVLGLLAVCSVAVSGLCGGLFAGMLQISIPLILFL